MNTRVKVIPLNLYFFILHPSSFILIVTLILAIPADVARATDSVAAVVAANQPKMVKIYGAGGVRGLEPYQSGFLISPTGHILTAWSYVLDTDYITAALDDGRRFEAKLTGADPRLELAVLKIDAADLPYFDLKAAVPADAGSRVRLRPAIRIWPAVGLSAPNKSRSSVVLPAPLAPVRNANSPRARSSETSRSP